MKTKWAELLLGDWEGGNVVGRIGLDKEKEWEGFIVRTDGGIRTEIYIFKAGEVQYRYDLAVYDLEESAYEVLKNSWIQDVNGDGILDIATRNNLIDFELSNEYSANISGVTEWIEMSTPSGFEQEYWQKGILPGAKLQK